MRPADPKLAAQERFAQADWDGKGLDLVRRCATDPPLVVRGLLDAIAARAGAGERVVELGFGSGWLLDSMREELVDRRLYGLDLSAGAAAESRRRYGGAVDVVVGDMERLPYGDSQFDVIVTCWTLYFMRDIDVALAEIRRCLRPGGRLIAATNAPDHEAECGEILEAAIQAALGRDEPEHNIGRRFDLETGARYVERHFRNVGVERWDGEMVLVEPRDVAALWPKWEPALMGRDEQQAVRDEFVRLGRARVARDGELRIRRRNGAFICDL